MYTLRSLRMEPTLPNYPKNRREGGTKKFRRSKEEEERSGALLVGTGKSLGE